VRSPHAGAPLDGRAVATIISPPGYTVVPVDEFARVLGHDADVEYPYRRFDEDQEFRVYAGGLHVVGDLSPEPDVDWVPYNTVVDGDLTVDGDLDWWDLRYGNLLVVTGTVRARTVLLYGCPNVIVRGDLIAENGVLGHRGEDGGLLSVAGRTRTPYVVNTLYFRMLFGTDPDAAVLGDPGRTGCPVDHDIDDGADVLLPDLLDEDGRADEGAIGEALSAGRRILRPRPRPRPDPSSGHAPVPVPTSLPVPISVDATASLVAADPGDPNRSAVHDLVEDGGRRAADGPAVVHGPPPKVGAGAGHRPVGCDPCPSCVTRRRRMRGRIPRCGAGSASVPT
jgi:hypothetical protein